MKYFLTKPLNIFFLAIMLLFFGKATISAQTGCVLLDKDKSAFFISYEQTIEEKDKKIRFRLVNNSSCAIIVPVDITETSTTESQACVPSTFADLKNNSQVRLIYEINYPKTNSLFFPLSGDVLSSALLKSGTSILFDVPVKRLRQGNLKLDVKYDWEVCKSNNFYRRLSISYSTVPKELLKKYF